MLKLCYELYYVKHQSFIRNVDLDLDLLHITRFCAAYKHSQKCSQYSYNKYRMLPHRHNVESISVY